MNIDNIKRKILKLDTRKRIKFIVLYGSVAHGTSNKLSDIDIAVFYHGTDRERFRFRVKATGELPDKVDLQIFQDLPLYVRKEVLKGKVLYNKDFQFTFNEYMKVIKDFNYFEKYLNHYYEALEEKAHENIAS